MDYKLSIARLAASEGLSAEEISGMITDADLQMGDFALPCFKLSARLKKSPAQIAKDLEVSINQKKPDWLAAVSAVNGYLNFSLERRLFAAVVLSGVLEKGENWTSMPLNGKTVTIDYSSINIAKDFHIGHLLTTAIGGSLYRIFGYLGYKVVGINHLGDWGTQFGKLICAYKKWGGSGAGAGSLGNSPDTMEKLSKLYVKFHAEAENDPKLDDEARAWFKKIEEGDTEALRLFGLFKDITLAEVDKVYKRLGITFDSYDGESFYNDKMQPVVDLLSQKGLLSESDGAMVVKLDEFNMPPCLILKSDGATLYATRDLAAALYRKNTYDFDENLYVVAYQQNLHFKQVFKVLELMGFDWANRCKHVAFGMVSLEGSGALSTRKGNVVLLKDVLSTAVEKTLEIIESKNPGLENKKKTAEDIGVGAVIFYALCNSRIKDMVFSFDKALNFDGETGPYLQYTHARCCSILEKGADLPKENKEKPQFSEGAELLIDDESYGIIRLLGRFEAVVGEAAEKYEPSVISRYLIDLAQSYNKFLIGHRVLDEDKQTRSARLKLTECVRNTLKNGMKLLLLNSPEKM